MIKDFNKPIFGKYQMLKIIGKGSFGSVYKGINKITKEKVAIKIEDWKKMGNILENEAFFLFYLKNYGLPEIKAFGTYKKYKVLVQNLLGENLEHIFGNHIMNFTYKDICMIAIQLIDRLEYIHSKYVIHRDLKPENIMIDLETKKIVYLIDFGMAKKYRSSKTKKHIKFTIPNRLTGTARYCSINALRGTEQSRRDDLESAGYVLIYLAKRGYLPWMGLNIQEKIERYRRIYQIKKAIKEEELCSPLPNEFCRYIKYVKKLNFEEEPDYNYLRGLFTELLIKYKFQNDLKFSWIFNNRKVKKDETNLINKRNNNFYKKKGSPYQRLLRNIQNNNEKENNMDNLNQEKLINIKEEKQEKRDKEIIEKNKNPESLELNLKKENSDQSQNSPCFAPIKKDEYSEDGTKIALFNMAINIEDSDEIKNTNENQNDNIKVNLNNSDKDEIGNTNNFSAKKNITKIYKNSIGDNKSIEKEEKNVFILVNDSFKGIEESERKNKPENNINKINNNNNDINNINNDAINIENNEINKEIDIKNINISPKKVNDNLSQGNNCRKILKEDINKKEPVINNNINTNLNKGKIIKIIPNLNHKSNISKKNLPNKNANPIKINFNKNKIHIMKIKANFERKRNNIKLNRNNFDDYFLDIKPIDINLLSNEINNNSLKISKSGKSINSIDLNKKYNYNRNIINYNKINIHNSNSAGKLIAINKTRGITTYNYKRLLNNNSKKEINNILSKNNYQKMNLSNSISPINTIENLNINSSSRLFGKIRLIKNKSQESNNRIIKNQKLNQPIFSRNKSNNNLLKLNLFSINNGQFNSQFNNNIIKNLNYSINNYVKTELDGKNNKNFDNKRNNKNLVIIKYNDKGNRKLQYQKLKMTNINKNKMNNNYVNNNINLSFNNKKKLLLPIVNYANNYLDNNKNDNKNYFNKTFFN